MEILSLSEKQGVLVIRACFPVRKVCSRVAGFPVSRAISVPERSMRPEATMSRMFLPSTSSGLRPEMVWYAWLMRMVTALPSVMNRPS